MYPFSMTLQVSTPAQMAAILAVVNGGGATAPLAQPVVTPNNPATPAPTPTTASSDAGTTAAKPDTAPAAESTPSSSPTAESQPAPSGPIDYDRDVKKRLQAYAAKNMAGALALLGKYGAKKGTELKADDLPAVLKALEEAGF